MEYIFLFCFVLFCFVSEHYSTVTIQLEQKDDRTELKLTQTGIPASDFERTRQGWKQYYWGSIKQTFCIGMKYF